MIFNFYAFKTKDWDAIKFPFEDNCKNNNRIDLNLQIIVNGKTIIFKNTLHRLISKFPRKKLSYAIILMQFFMKWPKNVSNSESP